jgi:RloB-like protein
VTFLPWRQSIEAGRPTAPMARDSHPRERQRSRLERKRGRRAPFERVLIVCEGSKTEPLYFDALRRHYRLHNANVVVQHSQYGTSPLQVVQFGRDRFELGDPHKHVRPRAFERVYAVFDRDEHATYAEALVLAGQLDGKLRNDDKKHVRFEAVASVPSFELWLLLHFDDVLTPLHRSDALHRLGQYLPNYAKSGEDHFESTRDRLQIAIARARHLATLHSRADGVMPYTDVGELVDWLCRLKPVN